VNASRLITILTTIFIFLFSGNIHGFLNLGWKIGKVAVVGGSSSTYPGVVYLRLSLTRVLTLIIIDVGREVIDAIAKGGNYEVTILSRKVILTICWMLRTSLNRIV